LPGSQEREAMRITADTTISQLVIERTLLGVTNVTEDHGRWNGLTYEWRVALHAPGVGITFGYAVELHDALNEAFENLRRTIGAAVSPSS
jgi:hypothetical protein